MGDERKSEDGILVARKCEIFFVRLDCPRDFCGGLLS